ncbi:MAG: peptide deformylase [Alphaproteobacteria bacterium]|jgi:peptide deformylase|nr:peptide deformylase [Alphaproteobacteria bacterium]
MILSVVSYPNDILKQKAKPILEITPEIKKLSEDMLDTMYANKGIGLAANQVGILLRIIVIDLQEEEPFNPIVLINPEIIEKSEELEEGNEGCLSIVGISATVKRFAQVKVAYTNLNGEKEIIQGSGLLSACLQHEIDHLDGILFIDRISKLKRGMLIKKYKKSQEEKEDN